MRCRNLSCKRLKLRCGKCWKDCSIDKAVKVSLSASPVCTALSVALAISTSILAACCAIHATVSLTGIPWTIDSISIHPSFPLITGIHNLEINVTSVDDIPVSISSLEYSKSMSLVPFVDSFESSLPTYTVNGTSLELTTKMVRAAGKLYIQLDGVYGTYSATIFQIDISTSLISCVSQGLPCNVAISSSVAADFTTRIRAAYSAHLNINTLGICSII